MRSLELKKQHNQLVKRVKELDALPNPTEAEQREAEDKFKEIRSLGEKITRQVHLESITEGSPTDSIPKKEIRSYSLSKVIKSLFEGKRVAGREAEISQELERTAVRKSPQGYQVPVEVLLPETRAVVGEGTTDTSIISDPLKPELFMPSLREASLLNKLNIMKISAKGSFNFPRGSNRTVAGFFSGKAPAAPAAKDKIPESSMTFENESVVPYHLSVRSGFTYDQIMQLSSGFDLEARIREDLSMAMSETLDQKFVDGDNSARDQEPSGLIKLFSGVNNTDLALVAQGQSARAWKLSDLSDLRERFRETFKNNMAMPQALFSPKIENELSQEQIFAGTSGQSLLSLLPGYQVSNHMPDTSFFYGSFRDALIFTTFGSIAVERGYMSDDFETGVQRIRAILSCSFTKNYDESMQQITISRT